VDKGVKREDMALTFGFSSETGLSTIIRNRDKLREWDSIEFLFKT
ncbi:hypothetical protein TNCV_2250901, partial [Trichonephila clavipes]